MIQLVSALLAESHEFVQLSFWMGLLFVAGTLGLLAYLIWLRIGNHHRLRVMRETRETWDPIFRAMRDGVPVSKPVVPGEQAASFLHLWLDQREHAPPAYQEDLQILAKTSGLESTILYLLRTHPIPWLAPPPSEVGIAVRAARHINSEEILRSLHSIGAGDNRAFAIQACESLLYLRDRDGIRLVLDLLFRFPEKDRYLTARLGVAGGEYLVRVLDPFLEKLPNARLEDIVNLVDKSDASFVPLVERLIRKTVSDEELASLLRALARIGTPDQRELVVPHLESQTSFVRVQAAVAMGTVGSMRDLSLLTPLLGDPDWWVRYRSAQSCIKLLDGNEEAIEELLNVQTDRYAKDILRHVRSEAAWYTA